MSGIKRLLRAQRLDGGQAGNIFLVVAPSGAGKSTLVNALLEQEARIAL